MTRSAASSLIGRDHPAGAADTASTSEASGSSSSGAASIAVYLQTCGIQSECVRA